MSHLIFIDEQKIDHYSRGPMRGEMKPSPDPAPKFCVLELIVYGFLFSRKWLQLWFNVDSNNFKVIPLEYTWSFHTNLFTIFIPF